MNYLLNLIKRTAIVLNEKDIPSKRYSTLLKCIGDARVVMIGEASHGTEEFYRERAEITKLLIQEKGINAICVEADFPDAVKINRYLRGEGKADDPERALRGFKRFPRWMWRNEVMVDFIRWLRNYNDTREQPFQKVGFYGLDLYSLIESAHMVIEFLEKIDPAAAQNARKRYSCFDRFGGDTQLYGQTTSFGLTKNCQQEVTIQLVALLKITGSKFLAKKEDPEELFNAQQNAKVVKNAEEYYRSMLTENTWNLRDKHFLDTLVSVLDHIHKMYPDQLPTTKAAVWAHNSHLGDASFTEKNSRDEINMGQIAREFFGIENTYNIGFTTNSGTVSAADSWDSPRKSKTVRPGMKNSFEELFHSVGLPFFMLHFRSNDNKEIAIDKELVDKLEEERLERAIGVIYRPETERQSHYFHARISKQFDTVIHVDATNALKALDKESVLHEETEDRLFGV